MLTPDTPPPEPRTRRGWNIWALREAATFLDDTLLDMLGDDQDHSDADYTMFEGFTPEDYARAKEAAQRTARFLRKRAELLATRELTLDNT